MQYCIAIDVGIKNLSICVYDSHSNKVVHWDNTAITDGKYLPMHNVKYVRDFIERHSKYFSFCSTVVVERQMRCNMRIIEAVLQTLYFDRCLVISPRCVKAHYGLAMRNYRQNKEKAVEWARDFVLQNAGVFCEGVVAHYQKQAKRDDLADSLLLLMYYLDTYSNQRLC